MNNYTEAKLKKMSDERKEIIEIQDSLYYMEDPLMDAVANTIKSSTNDGRSVQLGSLDDEISSQEMYAELVRRGILKVEERKVTRIEKIYTPAKFKHTFVKSGASVKVKSQMLKMALKTFLGTVIKDIKQRRGE